MGNPTTWGPYFWKLVHNITVLYPDNPTDTDKLMMMKFFNSYLYLLPCVQCELHFRKNLIAFPMTNEYLKSKNCIVLWGIKIHNIVNVMLRKRISFTETQETIMNEIKKYKMINTLQLLGNVLYYATIENTYIDSEHPNVLNAFAELFNSVSYFLLYKNINLIKILEQKKIPILFCQKKNILALSLFLQKQI
jgi:hypothetical protein